jgi:CubicO group peptidase (beta-lactamase class C family)
MPESAVTLCAVIAPPDAAAQRLHGVLVQRDGVTLAESYTDGPDREAGSLRDAPRRFDAETLHGVRSISKSIVGLLVGVALDEGAIPSLDTPALDLLPKRAAFATPEKKRITVRHLLTMSTGLKWSEDGLLSDETRMEFSRDMAAYVLERPAKEAPGARYQYNSGATVLLAEIIEATTGRVLADYAQEKLFTPLGVTRVDWTTGRDGRPMPHAGLRLTPRDLAKIGTLVLNHGRFGDVQVVPADYMRASVTGVLPAERDWRYGYQWRVGTTNGQNWIGAFGNGGQRLYIAPAQKLVVVITAGRYDRPYPQNGAPSEALFARILDATR